ncbi:hypothetical protein, partial [Fibrobacter sp.]|uniref:hypothetical protein n=1 Tax=Fibrobacter sp. TaxID=35828 RepID=UPI00388E0EDD
YYITLGILMSTIVNQLLTGYQLFITDDSHNIASAAASPTPKRVWAAESAAMNWGWSSRKSFAARNKEPA